MEQVGVDLGLLDETPPRVVPVPAPVQGWEEIGKSVRGKPLLARTVGDGSRRVYVIGSIHGDEPEGLPVAQALPDLLSGAEPGAVQGAKVRVLLDMNPDGTASGTRGNTRGVDLNRNWPASNYRSDTRHGSRAMSELETLAAHTDITSFDPDVVIVFHSSHKGPFVNYDGNEATLAYRFANAAREHDPRWRVVHEMGYPTPGSLGTYAGVDRGTPILTVEFQRGRDAVTNTRAALAGVLSVLRP
jgi:protein MpaA